MSSVHHPVHQASITVHHPCVSLPHTPCVGHPHTGWRPVRASHDFRCLKNRLYASTPIGVRDEFE
jgi:hypothetical protein